MATPLMSFELFTPKVLESVIPYFSNVTKGLKLRGNFFQCHVFAMKSVQNLKSFWRSSQNYFVFALFSSLYS
jgi:hypothetical protein